MRIDAVRCCRCTLMPNYQLVNREWRVESVEERGEFSGGRLAVPWMAGRLRMASVTWGWAWPGARVNVMATLVKI